MKAPGVLLVLPLLLSACAASLERDYEAGAVTPYARAVLAEASVPDRAPPAPPPEMKRARDALEKLAREWKARAGRPSVDPGSLGFDAAASAAEADLRGPLSPRLVLAAAYALSPAIRSSRDALRATVQQFDQVAYLDAILAQYLAFTKDLDLRLGSARQKRRVERSFPFPGSLSLKSRIVEEDARAAEARLAETVRERLVAAGRAYYEYAFVREAIGIVKENVGLLRGIVSIAESKYGVGKTGQAVVLKTHVEIAALEDRLVTLGEREATVRARLASILGLSADFPFGPPGRHEPLPPPPDPKPLYGLARRRRQEITALEAKIRRTENLIELAETKAYPDPSPGFSSFEEGTMTRVGGARKAEPFSKNPRAKPKFWFGEAESFIHEMRSRLEAQKQKLADLQARVGYQVKNAWFKWDAAWRQARLYRGSLLPQARQAYEVLESGWREGVSDFLDALDAQRTWLRFRLELAAAVRDTNQGRLSLLNALGTSIPGGKK